MTLHGCEACPLLGGLYFIPFFYLKWLMRIFLWFLLFLCVLGDIVLATWSWVEVRETIGWVKNIPQSTGFKLRHVFQYSPQSFLCAFCLEQFNLNLKRRVLLSILTITMIGILTEIIQMFIPSRIPALLDVMWNFIAAIIGATFYLCLIKYKSRGSGLGKI